MPNQPNPRAVHEVAAQYGMSDADFRETVMFREGVRDGLIEDPPATGPSVDGDPHEARIVEPGVVVPSDVTEGSEAAERSFGVHEPPVAKGAAVAADIAKTTKPGTKVK